MACDLRSEGPWDLVVLTETIYSLGWLYPFFDLGYLAMRIFEAIADGGRLLLANTYGQKNKDWLMQAPLIDTYHDLFLHVGFQLESEQRHRDVKDGIEMLVRISLLRKTC
jgi:hypothetical protein